MYQRASRSMVDLLTTPGIDGDGVLDSVNGIKRPKTPTNTSKTTTAVMTTNVKSPQCRDVWRSSPEAEEPSPLPLSTHSDALTISEEPRDPRARKDTLALGAPPYLSQEQHLAHMQAPAPRPPSAATLIRRRSMPTFNVASPPPPYPSFDVGAQCSSTSPSTSPSLWTPPRRRQRASATLYKRYPPTRHHAP
ncbi:hypothetical protein BT96DRAFT_155434 [Gymnopus androsaceus JB14]|uniref:Uncharacterized protein n=1 Tax=Gymnopus androsaceus JB14 TaxID=1447944 RepID=A0A6A4HDK3_9AGAR|nr:hypothetical protein BT96DRAFT_155434 [Gymnopus androsaceus JB14]